MIRPGRRLRGALRRRWAVTLATVGLAACVAGVAVGAPTPTTTDSRPLPSAPASSAATPAPDAPSASSPRSVATPASPSSPPSAPQDGTALAAVGILPVKGRAPKTGYDRSRFGSGWATTSNGCNTRQVVLRRDLTSVALQAGSNGCRISAGQLVDPYTGEELTVTSSSLATVDIDHVVSLSDAWQKGAQQWDPGKRLRFANDLLNLVATGQSVNAAKGDSDTASWLPPDRSSRCAFVARQVSVKAAYGLAVTAAEEAAMRLVLGPCPGQRVLDAATARRVKDPHPVTVTPQPEARPEPESTQPGGRDDPRFRTCREALAAGHGPYLRGQDPEYDWYRDQDHDGRACET